MTDPDSHDSAEDDGLLEELGQLGRERRERGEADGPSRRPMPDEERDRILDRIVGVPETEDAQDAQDATEDRDATASRVPESLVPIAANDRRWIIHLAGYASTAAAAAVVTLSFAQRPAPGSGSTASAGPPFESWRIDGGQRRPEHLAKTRDRPRICRDRPLRVSLAVGSDQEVDSSRTLEVVVHATDSEGSSHDLVHGVGPRQPFSWSEDRRALRFDGPLERLAPLTDGPWTLQARVGSPGACTGTDVRPGCTSLEPRTLEVVAAERCDAEG